MKETKEEKEKRIKEGRCILEVDSPSYPPSNDEYLQCGCKYCMSKFEPRTANGSLD